MPIPELEKFRQKYPDYGDMDDLTLAQKLASKYPDAYSDLPDKVKGQASEPTDSRPLLQKIAGTVAPHAPAIGATVGGVLAAPANLVAPGVAEAAGIGGGYLAGSEIERRLREYAGEKQPPQSALGAFGETAKAIPQAIEAGLSGPLVGKAIGYVGQGLGRIGKEILGATTGAGKGAVEEAIKGGPEFVKAMRGNLSGEEIVQNAKDALQSLRDTRGAEYLSQLNKIKANPQFLNQVKRDLDAKLYKLASSNNYSINLHKDPKTKELTVNFADSPLVKNQDVLKKAITDVDGWTDNSATGLDVLKKRLSTYTDQVERGSPAQSFLTRLEKDLSDGLKRIVPGYQGMTKGYSEATQLIKDIESNLMLRPEGMTGRITADQTLRRLSSALRENFEMRRDLMDALSAKSGDEISQQVAGYAMNQIIPRGGLGKLFAGSEIWAGSLNPKLLPILATSSPRAVGEFLNVYGKVARQLGKAPIEAAKYGTAGYLPGALPVSQENQ